MKKVKIFKKDKISNILFLGTPDFAVPSLEILLTSRFRPVLIITQPDRPKGRGKKLQPTPVKISGAEAGVPIIQPSNINSEEVLEYLRTLKPDLIITVAYGGFLGKSLRKLATLGSINLHPSLLPRFRGASPLQSTMFANLEKSGNTIFKIVADMDAGHILSQDSVDIPQGMNLTEYSALMANQGAKLLLETLEKIEGDGITALAQNHADATHTRKIEKSDLLINWESDVMTTLGKIRGLSYSPGAKTFRKEKGLKILRASLYKKRSNSKPGTITEVIKNQGFVVACSNGELLITEVQPDGKKLMSATAYNMGARLQVGEILGKVSL